MENEEQRMVSQTIRVFAEIQRRLVNPDFKTPKGGAAVSTVAKFIKSLIKEYGNATSERIVDFCIGTTYVFKNRERWNIAQFFGPKALLRFKERKHGNRFYEDRWLKEKELSRQFFVNLIADKSEHPQAKYIYVQAEETTKHRMLNQDVGFFLCQASTLGWSPLSNACQQCVFIDKCKIETQTKYPELYRIRIEHGNSKQ